jgi:alkylation response protein AidB-like acyl-CoA dehydrogenase
MQFPLSEDQLQLQARAREFADREVAPQADSNSRAARFPASLIERAAELGFLGLLIPQEYGGSGLGNMALCLVLEEINRACASTGVTVSVHNSLVSNPVKHWGSDDIKRRFLPVLARGERLGAYCLTEPQSGSDAAALVTSAVRDGQDWVLNGTKLFITTGAEAGLFIVFARTDPVQKTRGISAFVVERERPGIGIGKEEVKMGIAASHTVEVLLQDCRVPDANRLGQLGEGFKIAMHTLDGGRIGIATQGVGIASEPRCGGAFRARAASVRPPDRRVPGDSEQAGAHGDRHRSGPAPRLQRGTAARSRSRLRPRSGDGEAVRVANVQSRRP